MGKITIYIPAMKLKAIDSWCEERGIARSELLVNSAMRVINAKGGVKCGKCKYNPSIGKYRVKIYDFDLGEQEKILELCQKCFDGAQREGVVENG